MVTDFEGPDWAALEWSNYLQACIRKKERPGFITSRVGQFEAFGGTVLGLDRYLLNLLMFLQRASL